MTSQSECISISTLLLLSIATSIDALGAGMALHFSQSPILIPAIIIGIITFINSLIGFWCGHFFKHLNSKIMEIAAGSILILLAIKVLIFK